MQETKLVFTVDADTKFAEFNGKTKAEIEALASEGNENANDLLSAMAEFPHEYANVFQDEVAEGEKEEGETVQNNDLTGGSDETVPPTTDATSDENSLDATDAGTLNAPVEDNQGEAAQ